MFTQGLQDGTEADEAGSELSDRERAILRAVAEGRVEVRRSCEPDLYIDGLCCSDQYTAHRLCRRGLIRAADGQPGRRAPAELTPAGRAVVP